MDTLKNFPAPDEIEVIAGESVKVKNAESEFAPGLDFYLSRLDFLSMTGNRALDASTFMGAWSCALSYRFSEVVALDQNRHNARFTAKIAERIGAGNISAIASSQRLLPFRSGSFDAVFFHHPRYLKDLEGSLREFFRVLAPGGRLYMCLYAEGWLKLLSEWKVKSGGKGSAFEPAETLKTAGKIGFADTDGWKAEGKTNCNVHMPAPVSRYPQRYHGAPTIWECVLTKPEAATEPGPGYFANDACPSARTRVFAESCDRQVISDSTITYPALLLREKARLSRLLGGGKYLARLARSITDGSATEYEALINVIKFVQRALFRDPVSQPLADNRGLPDTLTTLLCGRGRCGHAAKAVCDLCRACGIDARMTYLKNHIIAEAFADGRWVMADADAFKNGVIPVASDGSPLTLEEVAEHPFTLDTYPATGWAIQPESHFTTGMFGRQVTGYVDAMTFNERGYLSGYYAPWAEGTPPTLPKITETIVGDGCISLSWTASRAGNDRIAGYRVRLRTASRGWSYDNPGLGDEILNEPASDICDTMVTGASHVCSVSHGLYRVYASVTAISSRTEKEPATFFWPSDEVEITLA